MLQCSTVSQPQWLGTCLYYISNVLFRTLGFIPVLLDTASRAACFSLKTNCIYLDVACATLSHNSLSKETHVIQKGQSEQPISQFCLPVSPLITGNVFFLGKKKATHLENRIQRSFSSKPSQLCLWRINKNIDDTMNIVLLLLSALLLQTRQ